MPELSVTRLTARRRRITAIGAALLLTGAAALPASATAKSSQIAIIQDVADLTNPVQALAQFRALGATTIRVVVPWSTIAPRPARTRKPRFDATNPNAYPAGNWAPYDAVLVAAQTDGMTVDFTVTGGAPRWAEGQRIPPAGLADKFFAWEPNAKEYGLFVRAVGKRYDGSFTPKGATSALPAVHFWAIWNEPNFGQDLGPQAIRGSTVSVAPMMYRGLVSAGWASLQATRHGHDTILIGEFAARGLNGKPSKGAPQGFPGNYSQTKPLQFIRTLYCLGADYRQLTGATARLDGCPTTRSARRSFRKRNPGLFKASGVGDHPYADYQSPVLDGRFHRDWATFPDLGNLERVLDRVNKVYGSHKRYSIYNDEYGYITSPPAAGRYVSPATGAYYINWAEYLSWKSPRVASYMQFLLYDPPPNRGPYSGFASGLLTFKGQPKPAFDAYRLPVYMPQTSFSRSSNQELWGAVRPAAFLSHDGDGPQTVAIQLNGRTLAKVPVTSAGGYFDVHMKFPSNGTVRLAWSYPKSDSFLPIGDLGRTVFSRGIAINVN